MSILTTNSTDEHRGVDLSNVPLQSIEVEGLTAEVPSLLVDCFRYILSQGLVEGIFRVSGSIKRMRDVSTDYAGYEVWLETRNPSPHDVSGIIKKFTREYLHSLGGLFPQSVLGTLRSLFTNHNRKGSVLSSESFRSTSTSYSSGLASVAEDAHETNYSVNSSPDEKLDAIASLLARKNSSGRNAFFIYFLSVLKCVSAHQEQTRMPNANLAIVFQQYLLETWVVSELQSYQDLLEFLLDNFDEFVAKYRSKLDSVATSHDIDAVLGFGTMNYLESFSTSPLTDYSTHQSSPPKFSATKSSNSCRRSSLGQRFNSFWELYASPANKSKRFSFVSRGSAKSSAERLPLDQRATTQRSISAETGTIEHDLADRGLPNGSAESLRMVHTLSKSDSTADMSRSKNCLPLGMSLKRDKHKSQPKKTTRSSAPESVVSLPESPPGDLLLPLPSNFSDDVFPPDIESSSSTATKTKSRSIGRRFSVWFKGK